MGFVWCCRLAIYRDLKLKSWYQRVGVWSTWGLSGAVGCQPQGLETEVLVCPKPPPFDTETSFFNPSRLPTYSTRQAPRGPNPHHLTPRLQFLILVGSQPTAPDKPHVAQTPPFDTKTSVSNPCRLPTYSTRQTTRSPNPYPLTPRLQFLIPVGCQPTAPDKPLQHQTNPT